MCLRSRVLVWVHVYNLFCVLEGALAPGPGKGRGAKRKQQQQQEGTAAGATKRTRRYQPKAGLHVLSELCLV